MKKQTLKKTNIYFEKYSLKDEATIAECIRTAKFSEIRDAAKNAIEAFGLAVDFDAESVYASSSGAPGFFFPNVQISCNGFYFRGCVFRPSYDFKSRQKTFAPELLFSDENGDNYTPSASRESKNFYYTLSKKIDEWQKIADEYGKKIKLLNKIELITKKDGSYFAYIAKNFKIAADGYSSIKIEPDYNFSNQFIGYTMKIYADGVSDTIYARVEEHNNASGAELIAAEIATLKKKYAAWQAEKMQQIRQFPIWAKKYILPLLLEKEQESQCVNYMPFSLRDFF